jgi:protein ImuB
MRNVDGADGAWVDVTGVAHLFGGEAGLVGDLHDRLVRLGLTVGIGMADTLGAAHALARHGAAQQVRKGRRAIVMAPAGQSRAALAELPVTALRLEEQAVRLLLRLGLKRIGQLYSLPRAALAARFRAVAGGTGKRGRAGRLADSEAASVVLRLDQALGLIAEPRAPLRPAPEALVRLAFSEPLITGEGMAQALIRLAQELGDVLARQSLGARRFRLSLYLSDGTVARMRVGTSAPGRNAAHIADLLAKRLEAVDAGFGIDVATLEAADPAPLAASQGVLDARSAAVVRAATGALVDRLANRLGAGCVLRFEAAASHVPERTGHWRPILAAAPQPGGGGRASTDDGAHAPPPVPPRPPLLLGRPEPIAVIAALPDGAPQRFVWRRLARRIVSSEGPERIGPEWWRHIGGAPAAGAWTAVTRDYYRLEDTTGARYWVFRAGLYGDEDAEENEAEAALDDGLGTAGGPMLPRWFLHGLFP